MYYRSAMIETAAGFMESLEENSVLQHAKSFNQMLKTSRGPPILAVIYPQRMEQSCSSHCPTWQRRQWHPLQYSCLENPMDRGAWWAAVHEIAESDMTERLHFHFSLSCIGEGNGSPLQCSCLENPRDGGAWWAAVYGVAQSPTWLKWLSSSNLT